MYTNINEHLAAAVQAELRNTIVQMKEQKAPTRNSLKSGKGARGEAGRLAGLEIPFYNGVPHGEAALDPISGVTSMGRFIPAVTDKMFVGLAFMSCVTEWEHFHENDAEKGFLPESRFTQRDRVMNTYFQHTNWYSIGTNTGSLAVVSVGGGSGSITFTNDNTARGRSKGSIRLAISNSAVSGKRVEYESYTPATDVKTATFYITAKASATTATVVVTDGGTLVAGDVVVKKGQYKAVPYGLGYFCNEASRQMQGANTGTYGFLNARRVNGGGAAITPTVIETAKLALDTRANDNTARTKRIAHLTHGNYRALGAFGYTLRTYNAEKGQADTTFGVPRKFEDEDTVWVEDANFEDAYIYMRDSKSFFEYRQREMQKISPAGGGQYQGLNGTGSTEFFDDYVEAYNLAWDARGDDGKANGDGAPMSAIVIDNLSIPAVNQVAEGISLV